MVKRGRPRKPDAKREHVGIRLEEHEVVKLDDVCKKNGITRTDLIREAVGMFYAKKGD